MEKTWHLGIDLGSTYTRLALYCAETSEFLSIDNPDKSKSFRCRDEDFPSELFVFEDHDEYYTFTGCGPQNQHRDFTSAKFLFYLLARRRKIEVGDTDDMTIEEMDILLKEYPLVGPILKLESDKAFVDRVQRGLHQMFSMFAAEVGEFCEGQQIHVKEIVLTIPCQWDLNFEDVYRQLVYNAFHADFPHIDASNDICFIFETEALANLIFPIHLKKYYNGLGSGEVAAACIDFGGHNAGSCIYGAVNSQTFTRILHPLGAGGGSEHWEYLLLERCERKRTGSSGGRSNLTMAQRRIFRNKVFASKLENLIGPDINLASGITCELVTESGCTSLGIPISKKEVNDAFEQAHMRPLALAKKTITDLAQVEVSETKIVIVSGGTAKHPSIRKRLSEYCAEASISSLIFLDDIDLPRCAGRRVRRSSNVVRGALLAASQRVSFEDYLAQGAAFALERVHRFTDDDGTTRFVLYNPPMAFLLDKDGEVFHKEDVLKDMCFNISCDATLRNSGRRRKQLSWNRCYNLLELEEEFEPGNWYFKLKVEDKGSASSPPVLHLMVRQHGRTHQCRRIEKRIELYYDRGARCFLGNVVDPMDSKGKPRTKGDTKPRASRAFAGRQPTSRPPKRPLRISGQVVPSTDDESDSDLPSLPSRASTPLSDIDHDYSSLSPSGRAPRRGISIATTSTSGQSSQSPRKIRRI